MKRSDLSFLFWMFLTWSAAQLFTKLVFKIEVPGWVAFPIATALYGLGWLLSWLRLSIRRREEE